MSARDVDAETAHRIGLVSRVVAEPTAVAREVADNDARAVQAVARLAGSPVEEDHLAAQERRERAAFADLVAAGRPMRKG